MEQTFKPGDAVTLISGSVQMTVEDIQDGLAYCVWMSNGSKKHEAFPVTTLKHYACDGPSAVSIDRPSISQNRLFPERR